MKNAKLAQMISQIGRMTDDEISGAIDMLRYAPGFRLHATEYQTARWNALYDEKARRETAWKLRHAA